MKTDCVKKSIFFITLVVVINGCVKRGSNAFDGIANLNKREVASDTIDPKLLEGIWWLDSLDNHALFYIIGDSLYYTEDQQSPYFIKMDKDTLVMSKDGITQKFQVVRLSRDSLWMYDQALKEMTQLYKDSSRHN